jgi:hypothetical protein
MTTPTEDTITALRRGLAQSGIVDYQKLGTAMAQAAPQLAALDGGTGQVAGDYGFTVGSSFLHVYEIHDEALGVDDIAGLRGMVRGLGTRGPGTQGLGG